MPFGENQMKFARVRIELVFEISPNRCLVFIGCERDVEFRNQQCYYTSDLIKRQRLADAAIATFIRPYQPIW